MNILYVITILAIYILFMLIHKTEKKQNIIAWLAITTILILCYNVFICVICTFMKRLCTFLNLSIFNAITIAILVIFLLKQKKIQKYYVKISEIIVSILLLLIVIFVAYKHYSFPFDIRYATTDGSSHYFFAEQFYERSTLLYEGTTDDLLGVSNIDFRLPGAYVNEGLLFRIFDGIVAKTDIFIIFDLFILYLSGILFYNLLKTYAKENKILKILAFVFSIFYMLGYQLNSMQYGYVYLSLSLNVVITFLLLMANREKKEISTYIALPILSLLSFGIFFSYAYFIPIIYISIILNIVINSIKQKQKIISQQNIIELIFLIINPLILGLTYFVILPYSKGIESEISSIIVDGLIYKNYITNLLVFIPIFITNIVLLIKNDNQEKKKTDFSTILFILSILFAVILFIGNKIEKVSEYYFFKAYYIIWPLIILNAYIHLSNILEDKNKILKIVIYIYIAIYIITILSATLIQKKNIGINDIFHHNLQKVIDGKYVFRSEELKILEKVKDKIENHEIYILTPITKGRLKWMSVINLNEGIYLEHVYGEQYSIERWITEKNKKYYLAFHRDYGMFNAGDNYLDENSEEYEIIHSDEYGFILERTDMSK